VVTARSHCCQAESDNGPFRLHHAPVRLAPAQRARGRAVAPSSRPSAVPARLFIGHVDDSLEHEADRIADQVMRMPDRPVPVTVAPRQVSRTCAACAREEEAETPLQPKPAPGSQAPTSDAPTSVHAALKRPGRMLDTSTRAFFEPRFGRDFSDVRIHTDVSAAASAREINALAYTVGSDIVFADRRYDPHTPTGDRLLAHELAHTVQQSNGTPIVRRTAASCPTGWNATVKADHQRAVTMTDAAITKLSAYDGTNPPEVKTALDKHFKASGTVIAGQVRRQLSSIKFMASSLASYDCEDTSSWWCKSPGTLAETFWCVPGLDIRVCQPLYFALPDMDRSATLIHEWFHKYGCNFDLGYQHEPGYQKQGTIAALANADPFAQLVRDVQTSGGSSSPSPSAATTPPPTPPPPTSPAPSGPAPSGPAPSGP
jgi:hypothetical protein